MRRVRSIVIGGLLAWAAGCAPKVDPQSPFDEDDPRAGPVIDAGVADDDAGATAVARAPGVRTGTTTRAAVNAVLDASPGALLRGLEVAALRPGGAFMGWQLVRILPSGTMFAAIDVEPGDVLVRVNGHTLETPQDLSALWQALYTATAIDATIERDGQTFAIRFEIQP